MNWGRPCAPLFRAPLLRHPSLGHFAQQSASDAAAAIPLISTEVESIGIYTGAYDGCIISQELHARYLRTLGGDRSNPATAAAAATAAATAAAAAL